MGGVTVVRAGGLALLLGACGGATSTGSTTPDAPRRECTAALRFQEPGGERPLRDDEMPRTAIHLVLICEDEALRVLPVSTEVGACFSEPASDGALLRARCWWAGQGAVVIVRRDGDRLEALRADVDEHTGTSTLERVVDLEIPANHTLQAL